MWSLDSETAVIAQQIADLDVSLVHHCIFPVCDLYNPWSFLQVTIVESLINIGRNQQAFSFFSMIADKIGDDEKTKKSDSHNSIRGTRCTHLTHGYYESDEHGNDVHIDFEDAVGDLTVIIKSAVRAQKLAVSGSLTIILVG